jgi:hypothetical protein
VEKVRNTTFIIPYVDQEMSFWQKLSGLYGYRISEVYFPIMNQTIGTGRPKQPEKHLTEFLESKILPVSVLINPVVLPRPVDDLAKLIIENLEYYLINYNLTGVTLTNLSLAQIIKNRFPALKLTASTLMEIYNEQQLVMLDDVFDSLVPSNRVIRDIRSLKTLRKKFRGKIRIMVNESCLSSCVYRTQHFYEMSNPGITYPESLCNNLLKGKPWLRLTGGWVLPQHLFLFNGLYDEIKLSGRVSFQRPELYLRVLKSYIYETSLSPNEIGGGPASVNIPIDIGTEFYQYTLTCKKNCSSCSVCANYWTEKAGKYE